MNADCLYLVYRPEMSAEPSGGSPSPMKPGLVHDAWRGLSYDGKYKRSVRVMDFEPFNKSMFYTAHDSMYVDNVFAGRMVDGFGKIATTQYLDSFLMNASSVIRACEFAYKSRKVVTGHSLAVCSPTSGFHHAGYARGGGFCTFNGLIVAARRMCSRFGIRVGILDMDQHYGDGTQEIIDRLQLPIPHWSLGSIDGVPDFRRGGFVSMLSALFGGCGLVIYQAGADPHVNDPLGGRMTTDQMKLRDRTVFNLFDRMGIPVVWNLAGGYQEPIEKVIRLHTNTVDEALRVAKRTSIGEVSPT